MDVHKQLEVVFVSHFVSNQHFIQTIEAVPDKVSRGFLDDYRMVKYKCYILKAIGWNITTANDAIAFAKLQFKKNITLIYLGLILQLIQNSGIVLNLFAQLGIMLALILV